MQKNQLNRHGLDEKERMLSLLLNNKEDVNNRMREWVSFVAERELDMPKQKTFDHAFLPI